MATITSNPAATVPTQTAITSPAGKQYVDQLAENSAKPGYQADSYLASAGTAQTPAELATGNSTGTGAGSTDPTLRIGDVTPNTPVPTAYDAAMKTYLDSLTKANDLTLQGKKDEAAALDTGETSGFATGEAARVNRNNSFAIDAATNLANSNLGAINALKDKLPATPQPFSLNPGETRFDANGKQIASLPAKPPSLSEQYGTGSIGEYNFAKSQGYTGSFEQYQNEDANRKAKAAATGIDTSPQAIDDWTQAVLGGNSTIAQVPLALRTAVAHALNTASGPDGAGGSYSPLAASRLTMASSRLVSRFADLPQYTLTANGLPYLQRIDAALKTPGSVSDQDLLDSLTKLNTAGNAISDAQVKIITDGKSISDIANTWANKLKNGGVLSDNQRQQIQQIAKGIYANYQKGYQPVYDQVTAQLKAAGIPKQFWTIPDLNNLSAKADNGSSSGSSQSTLPSDIQDALTKNAVPSADGKTITIPRSVWSTFGSNMDAVLAEAKADGVTLVVK